MPHQCNHQIRDALAAMPLFEGMDARHLLELTRASRQVEVRKGQTIFRVGDAARELFILIRGQVKRAAFSSGGNENVLELVLPGQMFGEADLFAEHPYTSFAVAIEASELLCLGGDSLKRLLQGEAQIALRLVSTLARRTIENESDTAARQFRTGCQRVLDYLLSQAGAELAPAGQTTLMLTTSKQLIASRLGLTPETLSRLLRELADAGLIIVEGRAIHLQNAPITQRLAEAAPDGAAFSRKSRQRESRQTGKRNAQRMAGRALTIRAAINMAGRQRMLSQRMAKSWLLLGRGIQPGRSRSILQQSSGLFESQMATLATLPLSEQVRNAQAVVAELWQAYRPILEGKPQTAQAQQVFSLNEALLAATHDLTQAYEAAAGEPQGHIINLAGRQRMLSQRMAKFYLFQQWNVRVAESQRGLRQATKEFCAALPLLQAAARGTPSIETQLELVARHWQCLQSALAATEPGDPRRRAATVSTASERLLRQMDMAVSLYEAQSR